MQARLRGDVGVAFGVEGDEERCGVGGVGCALCELKFGAECDLRVGERVVVGGLRGKCGRCGGDLRRERREDRPSGGRLDFELNREMFLAFEEGEDGVAE